MAPREQKLHGNKSLIAKTHPSRKNTPVLGSDGPEKPSSNIKPQSQRYRRRRKHDAHACDDGARERLVGVSGDGARRRCRLWGHNRLVSTEAQRHSCTCPLEPRRSIVAMAKEGKKGKRKDGDDDGRMTRWSRETGGIYTCTRHTGRVHP
jgi:hypothetical protein